MLANFNQCNKYVNNLAATNLEAYRDLLNAYAYSKPYPTDYPYPDITSFDAFFAGLETLVKKYPTDVRLVAAASWVETDSAGYMKFFVDKVKKDLPPIELVELVLRGNFPELVATTYSYLIDLYKKYHVLRPSITYILSMRSECLDLTSENATLMYFINMKAGFQTPFWKGFKLAKFKREHIAAAAALIPGRRRGKIFLSSKTLNPTISKILGILPAGYFSAKNHEYFRENNFIFGYLSEMMRVAPNKMLYYDLVRGLRAQFPSSKVVNDLWEDLRGTLSLSLAMGRAAMYDARAPVIRGAARDLTTFIASFL